MRDGKLKFLHLADVHLDTVFQNRVPAVRAKLREAGRKAFHAGVDLALATGCQALLIAGDLFDNQTLSFATEKFLLTEMNRLAAKKIPVFYAPGNHDPVGQNYRLQNIAWPENVHIFRQCKPEAIPLFNQDGKIIATIVGAGHETLREGRNLAANFPVVRKHKEPVLALLHALVTGSGGGTDHERYAPCILADLQGKGYSYWALGHVHQREVLCRDPYIVYPGNLMGRHPRETGSKGAYLVEIDEAGLVQLAFHPLAPLCWFTLTLGDLAATNNLTELEQLICKMVAKELEKKQTGGEVFLRLQLSGPCPLYAELKREENQAVLTENLTALLSLSYLELNVAGLFPVFCIDEYQNEPHVLSEALCLLANLEKEEAKLWALAPENLAGCSAHQQTSEKIAYLKTLLPGLDYETVLRLVEVAE